MTRFVAILFTFFLSSNLALANSASNKEQLVDQVLDKSNTKQWIFHIPENIGPHMLPFKGVLDQKGFERLTSIMKTAFQGSELFENYRKKLIQIAQVEDLKEELALLDSPDGKKMLQLMKEASLNTPEKMLKFQKFMQELNQHPASATRAELIMQFDDLTLTSDSLLEMNVGLTKGIWQGLKTVQPNLDLKVPEEKKMRSNIESRVRNATLSYLFYAFRSLSDDDIRQFIRQSSTVGQKRLSKHLEEAYLFMYDLASVQVGKLLGVDAHLR